MDKKSVLTVALGYAIWGVQSLYWNLLGHMDPMFNLAFRILFSVVFTVGILALTKRLAALKAVFFNKQKMKFLAPAALFLLLDWGVFIFAVQTGHVLDTSLGYYMGPFVVFFIGMIVFGEKQSRLVRVAMLLALLGVVFNIVYSIVQHGSFPVLSILLACLFAIYGMFKKYAQVDSVVSIAAETIMMAPLAILFLLFFRTDMLATRSVTDWLLLMGAGVVTSVPMLLYSLGVLRLPFVMLGFMQYISPTLGMLCGLFLGETMTVDKLVTYIFIWAGLIVYTTAVIREEREKTLSLKNL